MEDLHMSTSNKRFLTIDLDVLFLECPEYHKYMNDELEPEHSWEVIKASMRQDTFEPDPDTLEWLMGVLTHVTKADTIVNTINEHDEMLNVFRDNKAYNSHCTNIDYHHDIRYSEDVGDLGIENWVTYARKETLIKDYHWITQDDASICVISPFRYVINVWKDLKEQELEAFDVITICISKHFTPPEYWHLADELKLFIEQLKEDEDNR